MKTRRDGPCEVCGWRSCPACSETELFKSMGITEWEPLDEPHVWIALEHQIDFIKSLAPQLKKNPKVEARCFAKSVNKLMLIFEEICRRRVDGKVDQ